MFCPDLLRHAGWLNCHGVGHAVHSNGIKRAQLC
jgi:hypothetical protein